jgi:hypothetical protein
VNSNKLMIETGAGAKSLAKNISFSFKFRHYSVIEKVSY